MKLYYLRISVQLAVLFLLVLVIFNLLWPAQAILPWLSRFSPLMTITNRLTARQWSPYFSGGVIVAFSALLFPRIFCGWICPLGTCIDITDRITFAQKRRKLTPSLWQVSILILSCLIITSILRFEITGFFDPLTISGNTALAVNALIHKNGISSFPHDFNIYTKTMPAIFLGIVTLSVFGPRTWCRILCPLGASMGLLAGVGLYRRKVTSKCIKCGRCKKKCKMSAIEKTFDVTRHQSCISCRTCMKVCPQNVISMG